MYSNGDIFVGEVIGTAILILFGAGVCAAVTLHYSKAKGAGWVVIAFGWGFGVLAGAYTAAPLSGGHLNPAVTLGSASRATPSGTRCRSTSWRRWSARSIGAVLAWSLYYAQFAANAEQDKAQPTLGIFSTGPEIRNPVANLVTEIIATIGLVLPILAFGQNKGIGIGRVPGEHAGVYGSGIKCCWSRCWSSASGCRWAGPPATPSTRPVTSARASPTPCCRSPTRAPRTGVTPGSRWPGR